MTQPELGCLGEECLDNRWHEQSELMPSNYRYLHDQWRYTWQRSPETSSDLPCGRGG